MHSAFQPATSSSFSLTSQPSSPYPQAGYNPQPQQPYGASMNYNPPQAGPTSAPNTAFSANSQPQAYNPPAQGLNQPPGQPGQIFNYSAYPPTATTPTNPYSRGGQPGYASRPQPPNYRWVLLNWFFFQILFPFCSLSLPYPFFIVPSLPFIVPPIIN